MKKVLIITRDFPPYCPNVGWMIRVSYLAKYLIRHGLNVNVIACKKVKIHENLIQIEPEISKFFIKSYFSYYDTSKTDLTTIQKIIKKLNNFILKFLKNSLIDMNQLDIEKLYKKACILIKEKKIKNVIISIPPSSYHLLAGKLKNRFSDSINLIVDYRDPWTFRDIYTEGRSEKMLKRMKETEAKLLLLNDYTLFASTGMLKIYSENFRIDNPIYVGNGYVEFPKSEITSNEDLKKIAEEMHSENRIILGFFGSGSGDGSMPHKDFSVLIDIFHSDDSIAKKFCLLIQGHAPVKQQKNSQLKVITLKSVSNIESRINMQYVDLCLHAHSKKSDAPIAFQGKVFDYSISLKPILFLVPQNAQSIHEFKNQSDKHFIADIFDKNSIENEIKKIISLWESGKLAEYGFTAEEASVYSRDIQYKKILDILK